MTARATWTPTGPNIDAVTALIDEAARELILPQFRRLLPEHVDHKSTPSDPDDIVTVVDRQVEAWLARELTALVPSAPVIGEETVYLQPELLRRVESDEPFWLLDPIDGTKNFVRGSDGFGVMLAWVVRGRAQAAWIVLPARKQTFVAEAGSGARWNGRRVSGPSAPREGLPRGTLLVRYMPDAVREAALHATSGRFQAVEETGCAAVEYTDILRGEREFAVYYRLLPWDHAAPALMLAEAGGRADHLDGQPYSVRSGSQLLVAARHSLISEQIRAWLRPAET